MPQKQSTKSQVSTDHRFKITDQTQELHSGKTSGSKLQLLAVLEALA